MRHRRIWLYSAVFFIIGCPLAFLARNTRSPASLSDSSGKNAGSGMTEILDITDSAPLDRRAEEAVWNAGELEIASAQAESADGEYALLGAENASGAGGEDAGADGSAQNGAGGNPAPESADSSGAGSAADAETETETEAVPTERAVSEEELDRFYQDAVFVGDSITEGFKLYCTWHMEDPFIPQFRFLSRVSFGVHNALWTISKYTVMPIYEGEERYIWDSVQMMGAKQVYMMFGQNDLDMGNDTVEKYCEVINRIAAQSPDAHFVILSMTYTLEGKGQGPINNENIRNFNAIMQQVALQNGWGFIDMANPLSDGNGNLRADFCSDHYVHMTNAAYRVWEEVLKQYATEQLKYTPAPEMPETPAAETPAPEDASPEQAG